MQDGPDNIMLQFLRRTDTKLDRLSEDVSDLKMRITSSEEALVGVQRRIDRFEVRFDRIERRLDLVEALH
jgi:hypothetical protein